MPPTHEVVNQVPPLTGYDVADDPAMLDALRREGAGWAEAEVREIGLLAGTARAQDWGRLANENPPRPWPWCSRARCWSATATRPSPTRSPCPG